MVIWLLSGLIGAFIFGMLSVALAPYWGIELDNAPLFWLGMVTLGFVMGMMWMTGVIYA